MSEAALGARRRPSAARAFFARRSGILLGRLVILVAILAFWEWASGRLFPKFVASSPSAIAEVLAKWVGDGTLWHHVGATLTEMGLGYAIGAAAGIACGLALGLAPRAERITAPLVSALYALPKIALAPLFVILFGIGLESKIVLVAVTVFFLLLYNAIDGVRDTDPDLAATLRLMGATRAEIVRKVLVPATLPWIFTGLRIAVRYAFTAAVLGEVIAGNEGIGFLIESEAGEYRSAGVFAAVFVLVIFSVGMAELLTRSEASALRWRV